MAPETVAGGAAEGSGGGKRWRLDAHREQLLADLPDHVTLGEIVPKLPWKCLDNLASVSRAWRHAVRSREIYNARVKCGALESLAIVRTNSRDCYDKLYLYSTRDGVYLQLPALPIWEHGIHFGSQYGIPLDCQCVTLDGAIYVLGGWDLDYCLVYVLDLAGPWQWKQCASMLQRMKSFTCVALDGKVYVVESIERDEKTARFSAAYDPKADTWCLIEPMPMIKSPLPKVRLDGPIIAVGEELIVLCRQSIGVADGAAFEFTYRADVYNPANDEWRVETVYSDKADESLAVLFAAQGKLHRVRDHSISVLDMDTKRWTLTHSYVRSGLELHHSRGVYESFDFRRKPHCVTAVGDEVLALARKWGLNDKDHLIRSEGFVGKDININVTWRDTNFFPSEPDDPNWHTIWELPSQPWEIYPIEL